MQKTHTQLPNPTLIPLEHPKEWESKGYHYRIVRREGMVCIVEVMRPENPDFLSWEVSVLHIDKEHTWPNGNVSPLRESYPSSASWGTYGFTCTTREAADRRFASLT